MNILSLFSSTYFLELVFHVIPSKTRLNLDNFIIIIFFCNCYWGCNHNSSIHLGFHQNRRAKGKMMLMVGRSIVIVMDGLNKVSSKIGKCCHLREHNICLRSRRVRDASMVYCHQYFGSFFPLSLLIRAAFIHVVLYVKENESKNGSTL